MLTLLSKDTLWIQTSMVPNPIYVKHVDPDTFHTEYGLVVSDSWSKSGDFMQFLETGKLPGSYPNKPNMDLGVTFGSDGKLRAWHFVSNRPFNRTITPNDRIPRLLSAFGNDVRDLSLATATAIQQLQYDPKEFGGDFLCKHPEWECDVPKLIELLHNHSFTVRPPSEWISIHLPTYRAKVGSSLKPIPLMVGNKSKKG